jgi:hypothetical protein
MTSVAIASPPVTETMGFDGVADDVVERFENGRERLALL